MTKVVLASAVNGFSLALAALSLTQDFVGRDAWVEYVRHHWVSGWVSVPLAAFVIFGCVLSLARATKQDRKGGE